MTVPMSTGSDMKVLPKWRTNSPFVQTLVLCVVVFLVAGMNTAVFALGAGGSHPSNIPIIDKINIVGGVFIIVGGIIGGSVVNKLGPKYTLMLGASGYPIYVGSMWWLDKGRAPAFAYFVTVYHGLCAGLFYTTVGYVSTSYASEKYRGKYIAATSMFLGFGSAIGSGIVLGLTAHTSVKSTHVPQSVYISIILIQSAGILVAALIQDPAKVRRNDGQAIALFKLTTWKEELVGMPRSISNPSVLLMSLSLFSCQMNLSLTGSLNAFYFNARTRALANFCFWVASAGASAAFGFVCDSKRLGNRRRRAMIASVLTLAFILGPHSGLISFLCTHSVNRHQAPPGVDWKDGSEFIKLIVPYVFLGFTSYIFQNYLLWLLATFTNEPTVLSRYSGYVEALKALGLIVAFGVDSNKTPFLTEELSYFSMNVAGMILSIISAILYTKNTKYGEEETVIVPKEFQPEDSHASVDLEYSSERSTQKVEVTIGLK